MEATIERLPTTKPAVIIPLDELATINATEAGLQHLTDRATELSSLGKLTSKDAYDEAHEFVMAAVRVRTASGKLAKTLAKPWQDKADEILAEGKRIGQVARSAEDRVRPLKEAYEAEQERQIHEKRQAAAAKVQERTQQVINLGMEWNGLCYQLDQHVIEGVDIQAAPDEKWDKLIADVAAYREEQIQERERLRIEAETAQRLETERLNKQREDQKAQQKLLDDQQAELNRRQREIDKKEQQAAADQKRLDDEKQAELKRQQDIQTKLDQEKAEQLRLKNEQKELRDKQKADKERQKRLAPDKIVAHKYLSAINNAIGIPKVTSPEVAELLAAFRDQVSALVTDFSQQTESL